MGPTGEVEPTRQRRRLLAIALVASLGVIFLITIVRGQDDASDTRDDFSYTAGYDSGRDAGAATARYGTGGKTVVDLFVDDVCRDLAAHADDRDFGGGVYYVGENVVLEDFVEGCVKGFNDGYGR